MINDGWSKLETQTNTKGRKHKPTFSSRDAVNVYFNYIKIHSDVEVKNKVRYVRDLMQLVSPFASSNTMPA